MALKQRWDQGKAFPSVLHDVGDRDWVRRVSYDAESQCLALGTASGDVVVCDIENKSVVSKRAAHASNTAWRGSDPTDVTAVNDARSLSRMWDGAVMAIDVRGDAAASGGKDGTAIIWTIMSMSNADGDGAPELVPAGIAEHPARVPVIGVALHDDALWTAALDGQLRRWVVPKTASVSSPSPPALLLSGTWNAHAQTTDSDGHIAALSLAFHRDTGTAVTGHVDGSVMVVSPRTDTVRTESEPVAVHRASNACFTWMAHRGVAVRAVAVSGTGDVIFTGGADGMIRAWRWNRKNNDDDDDAADASPPVLIAEATGHNGPVISLSVGCPGRLVSGALDGTVRVWDINNDAEAEKSEAVFLNCRYAIPGHTAYMGSVVATRRSIIVDGLNNLAVCYDYSPDAAERSNT